MTVIDRVIKEIERGVAAAIKDCAHHSPDVGEHDIQWEVAHNILLGHTDVVRREVRRQMFGIIDE